MFVLPTSIARSMYRARVLGFSRRREIPYAGGMKRTLSRASLVSVVGVWAACSPIQTVSYPVREPDGRTVNVDKYFSSLSTDDPGDRSFKQIQAGRIDEALATMKDAEIG